jgi:predicted aspartyl protease
MRSIGYLFISALTAVPLCENAWAQSVNYQPDNNCHLHADAKLPLTENGGHYQVQVEIGGRPSWLVVDTGADKTALTTAAADSLQLQQDNSSADNVGGVGDSVGSEYMRVIPSLKLGTSEWVNLHVPTSNMLTAAQAASPFAPVGLLGADVLSRYDVEFDFPAKVMTLYTAQGCLGHFAPWVGNYYAYSPEYTPRHRFILSLELNGYPVRATLDTGASRSLVARTAAQAAGVNAAMLGGDRKVSNTGIKGTSFDVWVHRFESLKVGSFIYRNVPIPVGDTSMADVDMLLGMDYMKSRRVWVSYSTGWIFMQQATPRAEAARTAPPEFGRSTFLPIAVARKLDAIEHGDEAGGVVPPR